uniref:PHD-type domain-containing protein n=1 Tax=Glossina brevipalpis TaxID=37001 RepID=A0A1A9WB17_9MUSC
MKKVARLRIPMGEEMASGSNSNSSNIASGESSVRTTGRIKKPKAVFDPSDNYIPRAQRQPIATSLNNSQQGSSLHSNQQQIERRPVYSRASTTSDEVLVSPAACIVCQKREAKRSSYANKNKLIACILCEKKIHRLCLKIDYDDFEVLRQNFRCENCRICELCDAISDTDIDNDKDLVTCSKCLKSYHPNCHIPNVLQFQQNERNWKCNKCTVPGAINGNTLPVKTIREIIGDESASVSKSSWAAKSDDKGTSQSVNITPAAVEAKTPVKRSQTEAKHDAQKEVDCGDGNEEKRHKQSDNNTQNIPSSSTNSSEAQVIYSPDEEIDVPDVKDWSVDQVTQYFSQYFPNEAHVFKDQEIDGASLLLLKRSDVIKKLPIKLGPSLRIYSLILKIQTQLNDPTLGWNCAV